VQGKATPVVAFHSPVARDHPSRGLRRFFHAVVQQLFYQGTWLQYPFSVKRAPQLLAIIGRPLASPFPANTPFLRHRFDEQRVEPRPGHAGNRLDLQKFDHRTARM
jgi:hypothetical protein